MAQRLHQRIELGRTGHGTEPIELTVRRDNVHRHDLDVADVIANRHQLVGRRVAGLGLQVQIGVVTHLLPRPLGVHFDERPRRDAHVADVAEGLDDTGLDLRVALAVAVLDRVPAAVVARHFARVAPLEDDRTHHAALRRPQPRLQLDHFVRGAPDDHVEAHLRDAGALLRRRRRQLAPPAAEGAEAVARQVGAVQRHAVREGRIDDPGHLVAQHAHESVRVPAQIRCLCHQAGHRARRIRHAVGQAGAGGDQPQLACRFEHLAWTIDELGLVQHREDRQRAKDLFEALLHERERMHPERQAEQRCRAPLPVGNGHDLVAD